MVSLEPALRLRLFADAQLVWESWYPTYEAMEDDQQHQADMVERFALSLGRGWLVEICDYELPENERYLRFGTDTRGMVGEPIPLPFGEG